MTDPTETKWRDSGFICPLHNNIEDKLDQIISRQIDQVETITSIKNLVENGLRGTVAATADKVTHIITRIETIERFTWFIEWVTQLRNNLFKNTLRLAIVGGAVYFVVRFGDRVIKLCLE